MTLKHLGRTKKEKHGKKQVKCSSCKKITPIHGENCYREHGKLYVICKNCGNEFVIK